MINRHDPNRTPGESSTTQDLVARYAARAAVPAPTKKPWYESASAEEHMRTRGRWLIIAGIIIGVLTFVLGVVWRDGFDDDMPLVFLLPLYALAVGAVTAGSAEYLGRPNRYATDMNRHEINQLQRQVDALVGLLSEELQQQYYRGYANAHTDRRTGTENVRFERPTGEVVQLRKRNDSPS